ncbi:hypothetical protein ACWFRM_34770, partial [Streptomyces sp. NPDC055144]
MASRAGWLRASAHPARAGSPSVVATKSRTAGTSPAVGRQVVETGEGRGGFAIGWNFGEGHLHDEQPL